MDTKSARRARAFFMFGSVLLGKPRKILRGPRGKLEEKEMTILLDALRLLEE